MVLANDWPHCPPVPPTPFLTQAEVDSQTSISAAEAQRIGQNTYLFKGQVQLHDKEQSLLTDEARYDEGMHELVASGNIHYRKGALELHGNNAHINLESHKGQIDDVDFRLTDRHTRGRARQAELQGSKQTTLHKVTYTSCNPGNSDWLLHASSVELNQDTGVGSAYNTVLSFMHVPFFYLPYISFPINNERKSGFLAPTFSRSTTSGNEFSIPYYLNLAPNTDATLTPHYLSQRGALLEGELRYLKPYSRGQLELEYIPDDQLYQDQRGMFSYQHHGWARSDLRSDIELNMVSDDQYFEQMGNSLSSSSITHLRQLAGVSYSSRNWTSSAIVEGYQTIDDTIPNSDLPYHRLPQIALSRNKLQRPNDINFLFTSEYTHFSRSGRPSGKRLDLRPGLSFPLSTPQAYLTPQLSWYQTHYQMDDPILDHGSEFSRGLPVLSIDSGLILERLIEQPDWLQTLEPRLYYLRIPYREQSHIPVFDSGLPDFTFYRLFADNRFNGIDRIGDTEQLTLAITTRVIDPDDGRELFSAGIGRIFYGQDRRVTLPGGSIEDQQVSALLATAQAAIGHRISLSSDLRWDNKQQQIDRGNFQLRYHPAKRKALNLAYRYNQSLLEQTDVSLLWPLQQQWHVLGRWNYSHLQKQPLEVLAGLEYQSCCWALRLASRRYISDSAGEYQNAVYLQLELKGLTSVGDSIEKMLENGILGYEK
jgi:LPS-assembly protein